jgi:hypothetical protein
MPAPEMARRPEHARSIGTEVPVSKGTAGPARRKRALPLAVVSAGMIARRVDVRPAEVVYLKGILEASEGLGAVFAERGGELVVTAPPDRAEELAELLQDLAEEIGARVGAETFFDGADDSIALPRSSP